MQLKNKNVTIIGMGLTGIATANFLTEKHASVTLVDSKSRQELKNNTCQLNPKVQIIFDCSEPPASSDLIVLSPGVDIRAPFLEKAIKTQYQI